MAWTSLQRRAVGVAACLLAVGVASDLLDDNASQVSLSASSNAADTSDPLATAPSDPASPITASPSVTATTPEPTTAPPTTTVSIAPATDPAPSPTPTVVVKKVVVTQRVPFAKRVVKDSSMLKGTTKVVAKGRIGYRQRIYQYTYRDGVVVKRTLIGITVTRKPIARITHVGTKVKNKCDPNYSGCVPIASDVDCAGGSGNGPAYVEGPVRVIGTDIYGLDADHDGIGCE